MALRAVPIPSSFQDWRVTARGLLDEGISPAHVVWGESFPLFERSPTHIPTTPIQVPKGFVALARVVGHHRSKDRWELLYKILWRLTHGEDALLTRREDPDIEKAERMRKAVCREIQIMQGRVRFQRITPPDGERFVAWYSPQHNIVPLIAPFLVRRFGALRWSLLTPDLCAHWDLKALNFSAGVKRELPVDDRQIGSLWLEYYQSVLNPARSRPRNMYAVAAMARRAKQPVTVSSRGRGSRRHARGASRKQSSPMREIA